MDDGDEPKGLAGEPRGENIPLVVGEGPDKEVEQTRAKRQGEEPEFETIDEQVAYYERKVRTCHKAKDKAAEGEALCNLGILFYKTAKFSDAKCCHERHLALAKACQEPRAIRRAYCNLGCSFRRIGHLDRARECYEEGLKIAEELGDCAGEAKLLNNLGNILEEEGDLDKAIYYHQRRMKVAKTVNDLDGESKACASIGNIYHLLGNIRQSIAFYERLVSCLKYKLEVQRKKGITNDGDDDGADAQADIADDAETQPAGADVGACATGEDCKTGESEGDDAEKKGDPGGTS